MEAPQEFLGLVREFISLIEDREKLKLYEILRRCDFLLPSIYAHTTQLPDVDPDTVDSEEFPEVESPFQSLRRLFGKYDTYHFFYDLSLDEEPCGGSLSDDLADIYLDLKRGLLEYEKGNRNNAIWEWNFGMKTHYGRHITAAMSVIHLLVHDSMEEDYENRDGSA